MSPELSINSPVGEIPAFSISGMVVKVSPYLVQYFPGREDTLRAGRVVVVPGRVVVVVSPGLGQFTT